MAEKWKWDVVAEVFPLLLEGAKTTVAATAVGFFVALFVGLLFALLRRSKLVWITKPTGFVIDFIRCTPLLVQAFFIYYVLPEWGITLGTFAAGITALGIHYSTYLSEVYRAGIENIPKGQWEAARALNFSKAQTWTRIVLPQAVPPVIPVLGNYLITMFKETPFLIAIALPEMLLQAKLYGSSHFRYIEAVTMVGVIFLALSLPSAMLIHTLERKLNRR
ncbi:ectoine/hydroxyectoine ABC transporter permease subunit EhuD [Paenibacillus thermotolerans]|uniref:ectoine/hydroxyectoine ABC transporter permease subunit EhuD n=1 Tax=Paenibacillus thermotolerans TaxID=3027807 RepID=UPI002367BF1D|nr:MULTISPECIES: ectoine/hydroxyectoine ABC transporter permease subunit EhuD [unclassified Paenibacillus]